MFFFMFQLTEATTDALFNLPAMLTRQNWSKLAPTFLYSFEYAGQTSAGRDFLAGVPIAASNTEKDQSKVGHGDELGYLFDPCDVFGRPMKGSEVHFLSFEV